MTVLTPATHAFRGTLGAKVVICNPADPEAKGLVERANGYLETSFLAGRTFTSPQDVRKRCCAFGMRCLGWMGAERGSRRAASRPMVKGAS